MIIDGNQVPCKPGSLAVPLVLTAGVAGPPLLACLPLVSLGRMQLPEPWALKGPISWRHAAAFIFQFSSLSLKTKPADRIREIDYSVDEEKWYHSC